MADEVTPSAGDFMEIEVLVHLNVKLTVDGSEDLETLSIAAVNKAILAARQGFREFDDLVALVDPQ